MGSLFKSPKSHVQGPEETARNVRTEAQLNNPNRSNPFGSSTVTWDGDQATIEQSFSPRTQGIVNRQFEFLEAGPSTLGEYSNPFISELMNAYGSRVMNRAGMNSPSSDYGYGRFGGNDPGQAARNYRPPIEMTPNGLDDSAQGAGDSLARALAGVGGGGGLHGLWDSYQNPMAGRRLKRTSEVMY